MNDLQQAKTKCKMVENQLLALQDEHNMFMDTFGGAMDKMKLCPHLFSHSTSHIYISKNSLVISIQERVAGHVSAISKRADKQVGAVLNKAGGVPHEATFNNAKIFKVHPIVYAL